MKKTNKVKAQSTGRVLGRGMSSEALAADTEQSDREYILQQQQAADGMSWSEFMAGCGAPGKPCKHCGKEGDCRCSE